jgi:L-ascorbate metabolism protein UlaG (beta-lactamase superfamily)
MKRRQFIQFAQLSALSAIASSFVFPANRSTAQTSNQLTIQWLGHTCFYFTGGGLQVLVNPFKPFKQTGCTVGYRDPKIDTQLVLISSRLLDEGSIDGFAGNPLLLHESGVYQLDQTQIQGIRTDKDRQKGQRLGTNIAWVWEQAGIKIVHLGGLAGPIQDEERYLIGRPDVMLIPVGGDKKSYTPEEAKQTINFLKPKIVIPTHYKTQAADEATCDLISVEPFLQVMEGNTIRQVPGDTLTLTSAGIPQQGTTVEVLTYNFGSAV